MKRLLHSGLTLAIGSQHRVLVLAHGRFAPNREDWARFCDILAVEHHAARGQLVLTLGGVPDAAQRKVALARLPPNFVAPPVAVLSNDPVVRGVMVVLNWFLKDSHKSFRPSNTIGVAEHLSIEENEATDLMAFATELSLGLSPTKP